jgi:hypothetical protein
MTTINSANNYTTTSGGITTTTTTSGSYNYGIPHTEDKNLIEYIDFISTILGIDINYEKFKKMSDSEKKSFLREIKINNILK